MKSFKEFCNERVNEESKIKFGISGNKDLLNILKESSPRQFDKIGNNLVTIPKSESETVSDLQSETLAWFNTKFSEGDQELVKIIGGNTPEDFLNYAFDLDFYAVVE